MRAQRLMVAAWMAVSSLALSGVASAQPATPAPQEATPVPAPAPVTPPAEPAPAPTQPAPEPTAAPAPVEAAPATAPAPAPSGAASSAPAAVDAPVHVAPEPPAPEPSRIALGGPPTTVENWPQEAPARDRERSVYRGFSVRLSAQLGLATATRDLDEDRTRISGLSGGVMLDVGTTAADNLILYGRVGGFALNHSSSNDTPNAGSAYFGLLGAGARYHFMPFDWYGSGTLGLAVASTTSDLGVVENAKPGFGFQLETGKNWGTGPDARSTTIGLGMRFSYVRCGSLRDIDEPWVGTGLSLVFSLAYD